MCLHEGCFSAVCVSVYVFPGTQGWLYLEWRGCSIFPLHSQVQAGFGYLNPQDEALDSPVTTRFPVPLPVGDGPLLCIGIVSASQICLPVTVNCYVVVRGAESFVQVLLLPPQQSPHAYTAGGFCFRSPALSLFFLGNPQRKTIEMSCRLSLSVFPGILNCHAHLDL